MDIKFLFLINVLILAFFECQQGLAFEIIHKDPNVCDQGVEECLKYCSNKFPESKGAACTVTHGCSCLSFNEINAGMNNSESSPKTMVNLSNSVKNGTNRDPKPVVYVQNPSVNVPNDIRTAMQNEIDKKVQESMQEAVSQQNQIWSNILNQMKGSETNNERSTYPPNVQVQSKGNSINIQSGVLKYSSFNPQKKIEKAFNSNKNWNKMQDMNNFIQTINQRATESPDRFEDHTEFEEMNINTQSDVHQFAENEGQSNVNIQTQFDNSNQVSAMAKFMPKEWVNPNQFQMNNFPENNDQQPNVFNEQTRNWLNNQNPFYYNRYSGNNQPCTHETKSPYFQPYGVQGSNKNFDKNPSNLESQMSSNAMPPPEIYDQTYQDKLENLIVTNQQSLKVESKKSSDVNQTHHEISLTQGDNKSIKIAKIKVELENNSVVVKVKVPNNHQLKVV